MVTVLGGHNYKKKDGRDAESRHRRRMSPFPCVRPRLPDHHRTLCDPCSNSSLALDQAHVYFLGFFENFARKEQYSMKRQTGSRSGGGILSMVQSDDGFVGDAVEEEADEDMVMPGCGGGEKKRRLSTEQVRALERSFETENKLEPERKVRLARDLGLQPRQVAVWFQNRRARWKTKQLERDYVALRHSYDALRADHDALRRDKDALLAEIKELKAKLGDEDAAASFSSVKEEPVAYNVEPPAAATAAQGSSESDSSGVVNDAETGPEKPAPTTATTEAEAVVPGTAAPHGEVFFHGQLLKVEDDEVAFLGDDDAVCGGFFADLQPPSLPWWTEPMEHWA